MSAVSSHPFDLTGEYGGFIFTAAGKRRLLLRVVGGEERLLKAPKFLRRRLAARLLPGQTIRVRGVEERDAPTGASKWVISELLPLNGEPAAASSSASPPPSGPIRVCAKKNCWRQGGRELFAALAQGIEARGLSGQAQLKAVGCLDRCKQAPNADWGDREFSRCADAREDAAAILAAAEPAGASALRVP